MTQREALDILKLGYNVYLTGSAGSGKTFLLNEYIKFLKSKGVEAGITASTGIAATHINGITIHSWSGLGIKDSLSEKDLKDISKKCYLRKRFEKTKVLIIDEISMLQPVLLDLTDRICKLFKSNLKPFGGLQVIFCGDFFQLPPISSASFANKSQIWNNMNLRVCYLTEQYRHSDDSLVKILNDIRSNSAGEHSLKLLRKRYQANIQGNLTPTKLYTHNIDIDLINNRELEKLQGETMLYNMISRGNPKLREFLKKSCLAPKRLALKIGAAIMFVKNNFESGYVNGTLGKIIAFDYGNMPIVETFNGKKIMVAPESWKIEDGGEIKAEITQIPLRLAWAITIHKSQGMTLDAAEIDLSKSFVEGMGYVAFSRIRSLEGLRLMGLNQLALKVNDEILELDKELIKNSEITAVELRNLNPLIKEKGQKEFLQSILPKQKEKPISTYEQTKLLIEQKLSIAEIAKRRNMTKGTIAGHLEKMIAKGDNLDLQHLQSSIPKDRLEKIRTAFKKSGGMGLSPAREILGEEFSYDELRLARLVISVSC